MTTSPAARVRSAFTRSATTVPAEPTADEVTSPTNPNAGLNAQDQANLASAIQMERTLQDLYTTSIDRPGIAIIQRAHEAFATRLAGIAGTSSTVRNEALFASNADAFQSDPLVAGAAAEVVAVNQYLEWVVQATDPRVVAAMSSIAITEARFSGLLEFGAEAELIELAVAEMATEAAESTSTDTTEAPQ